MVLRVTVFSTVIIRVSTFLKGVYISDFLVVINFLTFFYILLLWFKDLSTEAIAGYHTHKLEIRLRVGLLFFILREVFFFFRFFWAFFDAAVAPTAELGLCWPPKGVISVSFYRVPLLNTVILLTSGVSVTYAHHAILENNYRERVVSLAATLFLGGYFLYTQVEEYSIARFAIADRVYGRVFYIATGFHGFHVLIGARILTYALYNMLRAKMLPNHHFSFEAAAWYWHFVDVVWLFLYVVIYVWFC